MAEIVTTKGIAHYFEELFKTSKEYVYIISPYIKFDKQLEERIIEATINKLKVVLIIGKDRSQLDRVSKNLKEKIKIYYYEDLHAKIYFNENSLLISSMNMHSFSQANNREIGVLFLKNNVNDLPAIQDCLKEVGSIRKNAEKIEVIAIPQSTVELIKPTKNNDEDRKTPAKYNSKIAMKLLHMMKEIFEIPRNELSVNAEFVKDYNLDSLDIYELVVEVEEEFDLEIPDKEIKKIKTISEAIEYVEAKVNIRDKRIESGEIETDNELNEGYVKWAECLAKIIPGIVINKKRMRVHAKNFPLPNIDFSNEYGFMTLTFNFSEAKLRNLEEQSFKRLKYKFNNYRLYWNQPNRISVYPAKYVKFKSIDEEISYYKQGIELILDEIKKMY